MFIDPVGVEKMIREEQFTEAGEGNTLPTDAVDETGNPPLNSVDTGYNELATGAVVRESG